MGKVDFEARGGVLRETRLGKVWRKGVAVKPEVPRELGKVCTEGRGCICRGLACPQLLSILVPRHL